MEKRESTQANAAIQKRKSVCDADPDSDGTADVVEQALKKFKGSREYQEMAKNATAYVNYIGGEGAC